MSRPHRLPAGGRIDRTKPLSFTWNGKRYAGFAGDTLASALLANGVALVARSWKYHRPRGIVSSGVEEPNAIVQVETGARTIPNERATEVELYDGLVASSVNAWPGVGLDAMALAGLFSPLMPAGFYYKTFMRSQKAWMRYERYIRKASGLGTAPAEPDCDTYDKMNAHCDVLVVGGGPAGLAAARAAGRTGARVILADEQSELGGTLLSMPGAAVAARVEDAVTPESIDGMSPAAWIANVVAELETMADVRLLPRSTVFGYHDQNFLTIAQRRTDRLPPGLRNGCRERVWRIRAREVVLATGAIERPIVFDNNDRPGIMLASAISTYINRYAVVPGSVAVVFTNNDSAYGTAMDLIAASVPVTAIVDARAVPRGAVVERARRAGIRIIAGSVIVDAKGTRRVRAVNVRSLDPNGTTITGPATTVRCDLVAISGGWNPTVHLHAQSGGRPHFDTTRCCFIPGAPVQAERSVGACNGMFPVHACVVDGTAAGFEAARRAGFGEGADAAEEGLLAAVRDDPMLDEPLRPLWRVPSVSGSAGGRKQFVDLQNDVTAADIAMAAREGYRSIEHVKRYTALGFGTEQGKLANVNGMAILAESLGTPLQSAVTTTYRPNYTPVSFGAIAGRDVGELFEPIRKTALHEWHAEHGAQFENVGLWKRPWYYPKGEETLRLAVNRECLAVRKGVGIFDASTLGKIDIQGKDAAVFLEWVYTNNWRKLDRGRCRYGLMLDENGMVMDDGVTARIGEQHYLMTTTTGGAARVMTWLERWLQTEWPHLEVYLTSVSDHWATAAVAGPLSRRLVSSITTGIDFSSEAFPHMAWREGIVAGVPARVMRISFSGEIAYEVNVCANEARHVWEALMEAGATCGITPYGTEAMHVLRAEKGYIIVGQDTDGSQTPIDLGMNWIVSRTKDFIGRRSLIRSDTAREDRKQLVGLLTEDPQAVLPEGGQILADASVAPPAPMLGHVTSSYFSANLDRSIALALVTGGRKRKGERVEILGTSGPAIAAVIADPVFIDPEGARLDV